jgi:hypothetical protein
MSTRTATRLAWSLWTVTVTLTALSLLLLWLNLSHHTHIFDWWLGYFTVVIDVTVGAIVASRRPENPVGWLLCISDVATSISSFASQYAIYAILAVPDSLPAGEAMAWIASWLLPIMISLQVFYVLLFPTGRLPGKRWRWVVWLTVAFMVGGLVTSALSPGAYLGSRGPIRNPLGIEGFTSLWKGILYIMSPLLFAAAALSVFMRLRSARGVERQQIKWLAYAAAIFALSVLLNVVTLAIEAPRWLVWTDTAIFTAAGLGVTLSIGIAILRYRLYDIDLLINRTLVYGSLTAVLALVYFGSVTGTQSIFRAITGQQSTLAVVASTLVLAALFNPLRRRIQSFIDRRFYRSKYDARKTLEAFSSKLRNETDLQTLNDDLVGVVKETMQPAHVSLWLRTDMASRGIGFGGKP